MQHLRSIVYNLKQLFLQVLAKAAPGGVVTVEYLTRLLSKASPLGDTPMGAEELARVLSDVTGDLPPVLTADVFSRKVLGQELADQEVEDRLVVLGEN
jgi:hypothetical protein